MTTDVLRGRPGQRFRHGWIPIGATPGEVHAATQLADGASLDESDPEQARIATAARSWSAGGNVLAGLSIDIQQAVGDPTADTDGAKFMRTVAAAPPDAPKLYRGMAHVHDDNIPGEGDVFDLGPTSFSRDRRVMEEFAQPEFSDLGRPTQVHITVDRGSRAVRIDQYARPDRGREKEHVGMGRYKVKRRKDSVVKVRTKDGGTRSISRTEIELVQVDESVPATTVAHKPETFGAEIGL